jgi:hypothetical protein
MKQTPIPIKVECPLGMGDAWIAATASSLVIYDFSSNPRRDIVVPLGTAWEMERTLNTLMELASFLRRTLDK